MTNTYNTLNPLGSTSPKDLFDNASNFDDAMNSLGPAFYDRFQRRRETFAGMETRFNSSMTNWDAEFQAFLAASGFEPVHLVYVDGNPLTVDRPTQLIDRAGISYRIKLPSTFPVILTGTWATDLPLLVDIADAGFKSDLASIDLTKGATLVGRASVTISSITELRTFVPTTNALVIWLKGFYSATPGLGEGFLVWDAASNLADDGGTVFKPTSVVGAGRFLRPAGVFRLEDFGAVGDGSTDNTAVLNAAFASPRVRQLTAQLGRGGNYRHSGTLQVTKAIELNTAGGGLELNDPTGLLDNMVIGDNITQVNAVNISHTTFSRVQVGFGGSCAIRMNYTGVCKLTGNRIYGNNKIYNGIMISRGIINDFVGNYIDNYINSGITIVGTDMADNRSIDNSFYQNRIEGGSSALVTGDFVEGIFVRDNIFFNTSQNGVVVDATIEANAGASFKFQQNDFDTCGQSGLFIDKVNAVLIDGNWFSSNNGTAATGVNVGPGLDGAVVSNNLSFGKTGCNNFRIAGPNATVSGNKLLVGSDGVFLEATAINCTMAANHVGSMTGYAVNAFGAPNGLSIDNSNRFTNIGAAEIVGLPNTQTGSYQVEPFGGFNAAITYNPPEIAAGAILTTTVALPSANLGDYAEVSFSIPDLGVKFSATIASQGVVGVLLHNVTSAPVDLGEGLLRVSVRKLR